MIQTVEAVVDPNGHVRLLGELSVNEPRRALVTVLDEPALLADESELLSEPALSVDWSRPEEDAAWSHLQSDESCSFPSRSQTCRSQSHGPRSAMLMPVAATGCCGKSPAIRTAIPRHSLSAQPILRQADCKPRASPVEQNYSPPAPDSLPESSATSRQPRSNSCSRQSPRYWIPSDPPNQSSYPADDPRMYIPTP